MAPLPGEDERVDSVVRGERPVTQDIQKVLKFKSGEKEDKREAINFRRK